MMIRQQMVCGICVYGPQTGRTKAEKEAFREELEMLAGLSDGQTMQFVAGDYNAHIGVVEPWDEESIGRFGCGTRNGERNNWNGGSTRMHSLGWWRSCVVERRRKEVHRGLETKDGGRKRWRRQWGRSGKHGRL